MYFKCENVFRCSLHINALGEIEMGNAISVIPVTEKKQYQSHQGGAVAVQKARRAPELLISSRSAQKVMGVTLPCYSHTIGFNDMFRIPDLLIMGLRAPLATAVLQSVFEQCCTGLMPDLSGNDILGFPLRDVKETWWAVRPAPVNPVDSLLIAPNLKLGSRKRKFEMVQLQCHDRFNRWPGERKYDVLMAASQDASGVARVMAMASGESVVDVMANA